MLRPDLRAPIFFLSLVILLILIVLVRPGYLANPEVLGTVIIGEIVVAAICRYRQWFFLILMLSFVWAGITLPLSGAWLQGRWIVLGVGALAGVAIYMRDGDHRFGTIHLVAFFCVLSAMVSALVSSYPQEALLKSLSLFLLFLYATTGARLAVPAFHPESFFRKLLMVCEIATYISVVAYFGLRISLYGNPNSLGAVMGVIVVPVTFWGFLSADTVVAKRRLAIELCIAVALLMSSFSRAGIVAGMFSCLMVCVVARQYRLIVNGIVACLIIAAGVVALAPRPTDDLEDANTQSATALFLYKGRPEQGLFGSRKGPWDTTLEVIRNHPWFGSGFGTSVTGQSATYFELTRSRFIDSRMVREHGNSYLAIMEWSGLLGVFPFYFLVGAALWRARKALAELRMSGNILSSSVPAASIVVAGFVGAAFEDWLFAVGYYVCVFFWAMTFILADLTSAPAGAHVEIAAPDSTPQFATSAAA